MPDKYIIKVIEGWNRRGDASIQDAGVYARADDAHLNAQRIRANGGVAWVEKMPR